MNCLCFSPWPGKFTVGRDGGTPFGISSNPTLVRHETMKPKHPVKCIIPLPTYSSTNYSEVMLVESQLVS